MKEFKEGDKVDLQGVVDQVITGDSYPVIVRFSNGTYTCFTKCGRYFIEDDEPALFHAEPNQTKGTEDMKEFKEGDRVVCDGIKGVVKVVNADNYNYQIYVEFDNGSGDSFTHDGKGLVSDSHVSLFHANTSLIDILKREGYELMKNGDQVYVGWEGQLIAVVTLVEKDV